MSSSFVVLSWLGATPQYLYAQGQDLAFDRTAFSYYERLAQTLATAISQLKVNFVYHESHHHSN
jgi:hypothetical protein